MIEELCLRGIVVGRKERIAKMKLFLVERENPDAKCEATKKHFNPKLPTAIDWAKDVVDAALMKTGEMRSKREQARAHSISSFGTFLMTMMILRLCSCRIFNRLYSFVVMFLMSLPL